MSAYAFGSQINEPKHRIISTTLSTHYTGKLNTVTTALSVLSKATDIHNTLVSRFNSRLNPNSILGRNPPVVNDSEIELSRSNRVHLSRLRCRHHNFLLSYRKRMIHTKESDTCRLCHFGIHMIHYIMEECSSLNTLRLSYMALLYRSDLWERSGKSVGPVGNASLFAKD